MAGMRVVFYTTVISPHQIPLARALAELVDDYVYVYSKPLTEERKRLGWGVEASGLKTISSLENPEEAKRLMLDADILMSEERCIDIFEARAKLRRPTIYVSERWFKPLEIGIRCLGVQLFRCSIPGIVRLLMPKYIKMALDIRRLLRSSESKLYYFPQGIHAARDMAMLSGSRVVEYDRVSVGQVRLANRNLDNFRMFGYYGSAWRILCEP